MQVFVVGKTVIPAGVAVDEYGGQPLVFAGVAHRLDVAVVRDYAHELGQSVRSVDIQRVPRNEQLRGHFRRLELHYVAVYFRLSLETRLVSRSRIERVDKEVERAHRVSVLNVGTFYIEPERRIRRVCVGARKVETRVPFHVGVLRLCTDVQALFGEHGGVIDRHAVLNVGEVLLPLPTLLVHRAVNSHVRVVLVGKFLFVLPLVVGLFARLFAAAGSDEHRRHAQREREKNYA